ncbi:MAG: hypothetical protein EOM68_12980 [Spirochaetia bacterium]|nr:hypothetical protein [Spirochaetia bacterium]
MCITHINRYRHGTAHDDTRCKLLYVCKQDHGRVKGFLSGNNIAVKEITTEERAEAVKLLAIATDRRQAGLGLAAASGEGGMTPRQPPHPWGTQERAGLTKDELVKVLVVYAREYSQQAQLEDNWMNKPSEVDMGEAIGRIIQARDQNPGAAAVIDGAPAG